MPDRRIRVLHCIYDDPQNPWVGGGGAIRVREMYRRLTGEVDVTVATGDYPGSRSGTIDGVAYRRLGAASPYPWSRFTYSSGAQKLLRTAEYDVGVIDFSAYAPVRIPRGRPVGVNVNHLTAPTAAQRWGRAIGSLIAAEERWLLGPARELSVISEWTARTLRPLLHLDAHIEYVGCGVPDELFGVEHRDAGYLLYFGRFDVFQKGLDVLLDAFALLASRRTGLELRMVGRGNDAELREQARRLGIADRVRFLGAVSDDARLDLLAGAAVVVMPSRFEGFGLVAAEAMAAGAPLVASTAGALPEVFDPPHGGVPVPPGDAPALSAALDTLLADPGRRAELSRDGRESARRFSWDIVADRHLRFLHRIHERFTDPTSPRQAAS